jgi:ATP-binding cassette subfamily F protein 3
MRITCGGSRAARRSEDRLAFAEQEIPRLDAAIIAAEEKLGIFTSAEESQRNAAEIAALRDQLTKLIAEWEELSLTLEEQTAAV